MVCSLGLNPVFSAFVDSFLWFLWKNPRESFWGFFPFPAFQPQIFWHGESLVSLFLLLFGINHRILHILLCQKFNMSTVFLKGHVYCSSRFQHFISILMIRIFHRLNWRNHSLAIFLIACCVAHSHLFCLFQKLMELFTLLLVSLQLYFSILHE